MRDYFGEFLGNAAHASRRPIPTRWRNRTATFRGLGQADTLSWKHKILWALSLAAVGYGSWKASKLHSKVGTALAKRRKKKKVVATADV